MKEDNAVSDNCIKEECRMPYCKNCGNELPQEAQFCPKCGTPVTKPEEPAIAVTPSQPMSPTTLKLAFWWERFVAWLIDVVIVGVVFSVIRLVTPFDELTFRLVPGWPDWIPFVSFSLNGVVLFVYWMLMEGTSGQSLGKMVMRIKVIQLDGAPLNMGNSAVESVGKAFLLPLDCLLGWILYPRRRQRIFNYISGNTVIKVT